MGDQRVELIVTRCRARVDQRLHDGVDLPGREGVGFDAGLGSVVRAVDAHDLEVRGNRRDLPREVVGSEPSLAEPVRQRVRCRDDSHSGGDHGAKEGHGHQRLRDVVELELVDAQEAVRGEGRYRCVHPEEPDDARQLREREIRLRVGRLVPGRGKQVRLPDAIATVEIARRGARGGCRDRPSPPLARWDARRPRR